MISVNQHSSIVPGFGLIGGKDLVVFVWLIVFKCWEHNV